MNNSNKRAIFEAVFLLAIAVGILLILMVGIAIAQDDTPFQPIEVEQATSPLVLYNMVLDVIIAALVIPGAVPVVNVLTSIGKRFLPSKLISASTLAAGLTLISYLAFWIAVHFGLSTQFEFSLNTIYQLGTVVLGLVGTQQLAHKSYKWSVQTKTPILGYSQKPVETKEDVTSSDWSG